LAFALSFVAIVQATQPSSTASCMATCPPKDTGGFALAQSNTSTDPVFCSYPAEPGENPNDFYCTYNKETGSLVSDHDAGFCPKTASTSCHSRRFKGEDNYTAMLRKRDAAKP
ncbi:hypothetical protein B0H12DRAFT_992859, partial [Mycena haematopus]